MDETSAGIVKSMRNFKEKLKSMGVSQGDMLYVASDMLWFLSIARKKYAVEKPEEQNELFDCLIDALKEIIGIEGTLLIPVFTWEFYRGHGYDIRKTFGETGAFGNYILKYRKDFQRTRHVSHSFMVWGRETDRLVAMDNTHAWLGNSPFDYLYENHGWMLMLHVPPVKSFTFMHYAEERIAAPHRYIKEFRGPYTDSDGFTSERIYPHFVRDLSIESRQCMPNDFLIKNADACKEIWEDGELQLVDLTKAVEATEKDLRYNGGANCYEFKNYAIDWASGPTHKPEIYVRQILE